MFVKFTALAGDGELIQGVVDNCPSVEALKTKMESMGAAVIHVAEATEADIAKAEAEGKKEE